MNFEKQTEREEGRETDAYLCTEGFWTIGIGHKGPDVHEGLIWTEAQIDEAFAADCAKVRAQAASHLPWFESMPGDPADDGTANARQAVVLSMLFQMGLGSVESGKGVLAFVHTLGAMRDGRYADAAGGMLASKWAKQTPKRCKRMAYQMETGAWQ